MTANHSTQNNNAHGAHVHERQLIAGKGRRDYKEFSTGEYYHIFNRGNAKAPIFLDDSDYKLFLGRLAEALFPISAHGAHVQRRGERKQLPAGAFSLVSYCLMPNHYHLLVRQNTDLPISALVLKVCSGYGKVFNKKYDRVGSLFQDQFKAVHIDRNEYLLHLSVYIHQNPKVAGLVEDSSDWKYNSYREYLEEERAGLCDKEMVLGQCGGINEYAKMMNESFNSIRNKKDITAYLIDHE